MEMDATQLTFEDASFDLVIEKGTLDAVVCGEDMTIPNLMMKEMFRVLKPQAAIILITHSSPENRLTIFEANYHEAQTRIWSRKQLLSSEVNLINILRYHSGGLTLTEVVKNPLLFMKCLAECSIALQRQRRVQQS